jgi:hypothetical protein
MNTIGNTFVIALENEQIYMTVYISNSPKNLIVTNVEFIQTLYYKLKH